MKTNRRSLLCLLATGMAMLGPPSVRGQSAPVHANLRRTTSEHFIYIYQASLDKQMPDFIKNCEDAHLILSQAFRWSPKRKTVALFADSEDIHNGWATVYPRPRMMIYASDSPPGSTIYEPGDYIRRTIFHEYTHVLTMDAQYGTDAVLSTIFGRVWPFTGDFIAFILTFLAAPPGVLAPDWYIEGLSVWAETEFVGPGRGRSTRVDMMLRMAAADDRLLAGNRWFLDQPEWPYGTAAYIYGLKAIEYAHDTYGFAEEEKNIPGALADAVNHSFLYNFNGKARAATGGRFSELAEQAMQAERTRQDRRVAQLKTTPLTTLTRLTPRRMIVGQPTFGPNGRFIFFSGGEEADRSSLYRYDTTSGKIKKLGSARTTGTLLTNLTPAPDRSRIYYTRLNVHGRDRFRSELLRLDTRRCRARKVTRKGRYRYPAVSPDGAHLAAIVNRAGEQSLIEVPIEDAGELTLERVLVAPGSYQTLLDPVYTPDGTAIIFVQANEKASRLRRVERRSGRTVDLLTWPCIILSPVFHPTDGRLLFAADKTGVYNVYRMNAMPGAEPAALTHVLGGLFDLDVAPDGRRLAATGYDSYGYYLTTLDYEALVPRQAPLPALEDDWKNLAWSQAMKKRTEAPLAADPAAARAVASSKYLSLLGLRLDCWAPWIAASGDGIAGGLSASFSDPTDFHILQGLAGYESSEDIPIVAIIYQYAGLYPVFTLYGVYGIDSYPDLIEDASGALYGYEEEVGVGGLAVSVPWPRVDWFGRVTLGYQYSERKGLPDSVDDFDRRPLVRADRFEGTETALWLSLDFVNATVFGRSHSLEDGRYVSVGVSVSDRGLGGDLNRTIAKGEWLEYVTMPWSENHVLKLEGIAGASTGDEILQGSFGLGSSFSAVADTPGVTRQVSLRGYSENYQVGTDVVKAGIAYRFPILRTYRNFNATTPIYLHQLFAEVFYEGGRATGGPPDDRKNEWLNAAGVEINFSTTLLRIMPISPGIGLVYAFDREDRVHEGDDEDNEDDESKLQIYILFKSVVNF